MGAAAATVLSQPSRGAFAFARRFTFGRHPIMGFAFGLLSALVPDARFFAPAYAYARWLDDVVDSGGVPESTKSEIFERQKLILSSYPSVQELRPLSIPESLLCLLLDQDARWGGRMRDSIVETFDTFEFDLARRFRRVRRAELDDYSERMGVSFARSIALLLGVEGLPTRAELAPLARAGCKTFMLRDLREDLEHGYINIPLEDDGIVQDLGLSAWVRLESKRLTKDYASSFELISDQPSSIGRLVALVSCFPGTCCSGRSRAPTRLSAPNFGGTIRRASSFS